MSTKIKKFGKRIVTGNARFCYGDFTNSLEGLFLFMANLRKPGRLLNRIRHGEIKNLFLKNGSPEIFYKKLNPQVSSGNTDEMPRAHFLKKQVLKLYNQGYLIIPSYFSADSVDKFMVENGLDNFLTNLRENGNKINQYQTTGTLPLTESMMHYWLDPGLVSIMSAYYGRLVKAREYCQASYLNPNISFSSCDYNRALSSLADVWHIDHSVLIQFAILLDDVDDNGTCMQVLEGSHTYPAIAYGYFLDEYIASKKFKIANCVGPKGTVIMHVGSVIHRCRTVPGKDRFNIKFCFTAGSNILIDCNKIGDSLAAGYNLDILGQSQREVISGIFPNFLPKGYEVKNNAFKPTWYKGV